MEQKAVIMDENAMRRAVARITYEILERNRGAENLCIVGILSRGVVLAERIARKIYELEQVEVEFGALDITPFRDDRIADATHTARSTIHFPAKTPKSRRSAKRRLNPSQTERHCSRQRSNVPRLCGLDWRNNCRCLRPCHHCSRYNVLRYI